MMKRIAATLAALLGWGPVALAAQEEPIVKSALHDFRVTTVAEGLVNPFSMTFTPEGTSTRRMRQIVPSKVASAGSDPEVVTRTSRSSRAFTAAAGIRTR